MDGCRMLPHSYVIMLYGWLQILLLSRVAAFADLTILISRSVANAVGVSGTYSRGPVTSSFAAPVVGPVSPRARAISLLHRKQFPLLDRIHFLPGELAYGPF